MGKTNKNKHANLIFLDHIYVRLYKNTVCIWLLLWECWCVCVIACVWNHMSVWDSMHLWLLACVHVCISKWLYVCRNVWVSVSVSVHAHMCKYRCMYEYIYVSIYQTLKLHIQIPKQYSENCNCIQVTQ